MAKQEYIYWNPQNPEFCKKMTAKYGEDWNIDDFSNDTSDDFITPTASSIRVPKLLVKDSEDLQDLEDSQASDHTHKGVSKS